MVDRASSHVEHLAGTAATADRLSKSNAAISTSTWISGPDPATPPIASCSSENASPASISCESFSTYPISPQPRKHCVNLGPLRTLRIGHQLSASSMLFFQWCNPTHPRRLPRSTASAANSTCHLLRKTTRKKCGALPCREISAEWGAQRIKGLSITQGPGPRLQRVSVPSEKRIIAQKGTLRPPSSSSSSTRSSDPARCGKKSLEKVQEQWGRSHTCAHVVEVRRLRSRRRPHRRSVRSEKPRHRRNRYSISPPTYVFSTMPMSTELIAALER